MRMDDETLKRILQEGMDYEADLIMDEVNSDPNIQNIEAPEAIYENMWKEIQGYKDAEAKEQEKKAQEEQELIRLGKLYKKKRARNKYIILIAAVVCALGIGTISFGDGKKVFTEMKRVLGDREQTVVNTDGEEGNVVDEISSESEAFQKIEEIYGFVPVKMYYIPRGMEFVDIVVEEGLQNVRMYYEDDNSIICYTIWPKHREASIGVDVEDEVLNEYHKTNKETSLTIKEYQVEGDSNTRWRIEFQYNDVQYYLLLTGIDQQEVDKIVDDLYFQ